MIDNRTRGKTTRLVDWAIEQAGDGADVVFLCAFADEVRPVTALVATTAKARQIWERTRKRQHSVEMVGGGKIAIAFAEGTSNMLKVGAKVAVDDWSSHSWATRMYLHTWAAEWRTDG